MHGGLAMLLIVWFEKRLDQDKGESVYTVLRHCGYLTLVGKKGKQNPHGHKITLLYFTS